VARKKSAHSRRRRAPSRGLIIGISVLLIGVAVILARTHGPLTKAARPGAAREEVAESEAPPGGNAAGAKSNGTPLLVDSDWDRVRLRAQSEYLRTLRPGDHAALYRLTSRTLRGALEQVGIDRYRIDERPAAAKASGAAYAPVQWRIEVPRRASLFRINDAVTQAIETLGGQVLRGDERPARTMGLALHLKLGYGGQVTHAIVVEPADSLFDADARVAFVVLDADPESQKLLGAFLASGVPFSFAVRPDLGGAAALARRIRTAEHEVLLHLPMEPRGYPRVDPGRDAILLDLSRIEIEDRIGRCLTRVGPVRGVVSRYGSAALNDPDVMRAVLEDLRRRDLPFLDAHGVGPSLTEEIAEESGARALVVAASIDASARTPAAVRARLKEIVERASQRGAVAVTLRLNALILGVLEAEQPKLREKGVEFVPASRLAL
jgi:hypothetical protein